LKNNSIYQIADNTFDKMESLKYLDLSINELMSVNENVFAKLSKLEELFLGENLRKIKIISINLFFISSLPQDKILSTQLKRMHLEI
jgi:Leucine-rich repeat (LRR) protein